MKRAPVFAAARAEGVDFSNRGNIEILDNALSLLGFPKDGEKLEPSPDCIALIKRFEGCRLTAYPDPGTGGAPWTIGWGSTTDELGQAIKPGTTWTQARADARLKDQVEDFGERVAAVLEGSPTSQHQFDALVSFAYNVGVRALKDSTLLRRHKEQAYAGAALEFARWTKAGGRELPGLVKRREAEAALYRGKRA